MKFINKKSISIICIATMIVLLFTSFTNKVMAGFTYEGRSYNTTTDLANLAKNPDLFLKIPASKILNQTFKTTATGQESDVTCVEHYNSNNSSLKNGKVWRIIDINPKGLNTVQINGNDKKNLNNNEKKYLNAIAEAASKCSTSGGSYYGITPTKAAYASLINSEYVKSIFQLNGTNTEQAYLMNPPYPGAKKLHDTYLQHGEQTAKSVITNATAKSTENSNCNVTSDAAYLGPFQYESDNNQKISFSYIKIVGKDSNGKKVFEEEIENPSKENLYRNALGTRQFGNGSIKPNQDFYIKTDKKIGEASKISVEIGVTNPEYYQSRILLFKSGGLQTFSISTVGNGQTTNPNQSLQYEFENNKGNLKIKKTGVRAGADVSKVKLMGFKLYYKENNTKKYLKITTDTELTNGKLVGTIQIKKQEATTANKATIVYTNDSGNIILKDIDTRYKYYLEEVSSSSNYSNNVLEATQTIDGNTTNILKRNGEIGPITVKKKSETTQTEIKIKDDIKRGKLQILKIDSDTGKPLPNVEFKIKTKSGNKWMKASGSNGNYRLKTYESDYSRNTEYYKDNFTSNENEATTFVTDSNGKITITGVERATYVIIETKNPNLNYEEIVIAGATVKVGRGEETAVSRTNINNNRVTVTIDGNNNGNIQTTLKMKNEKQSGELTIEKKDKDSKNALAGVTFKIEKYNNKNNKYEYIVAGNGDITGTYTFTSIAYTTDINQATTFVTDNSGKITLSNIPVGKYRITETSVGNNRGYTGENEGVDNNYVYWKDSDGTEHTASEKEIVVDVVRSTNVKVPIENKKKYLDITGKVWEDIDGGKGSDYEAHGKDVYADGDKLVEGITVRLKDGDGNEIKNTTTGENGEYEFKNVLISDLPKYYVEFEYDGIKYTSVEYLVGNDSRINSKAGEVVGQRKNLNAAFAEITNKDSIVDRNHGYSRDIDGKTTGTLTYDNEKWYSTFISEEYIDNNGKKGTNLTANTDVSRYSLNEEYTARRYITREDGTIVIENVNLGIRARVQPDIAIKNDLTSVKVSVNGYGTTYSKDSSGNNYGTRETFIKDGETNLSAKFGSEYGNYYREIYPSDIQYSSTLADSEDAKKLKVYATYTITITNYSNGLNVSVPEIVNYYDSRFEIVKNGIEFPDENGTTTTLNGVEMISLNGSDKKEVLEHKDGTSVNNYKTLYIATGRYTPTGRITDAPKIEAGKSLVINVTYQVNDDTVLNILSKGDQELNTVAEVNAYSTYYSQKSEGCEINEIYAGVDKNSAPGNAKPGDNSTYEDDTDRAPSFTLTAKGVRQIEGTVFEDNTGNNDVQSGKERMGDGEYNDGENVVKGVKVELLELQDEKLVPATYYPDAVSDDDGTTANRGIIKQPGTTEEKTTESNGNYIFKGVEPGEYFIRFTYSNGETKICDKDGKEVKDINVQDYKSTVIKSENVRDAFENGTTDWYKKDGDKRYSDARDNEKTRKAIDDDLKNVDAGSNTNITELDAETPKLFVKIESINTDSNNNTFVQKISNVDFGIVRRPKQSAELDKTISNIKVTLPNGQVLVEGDPREGKLNYVTITGNTIYITIDSELIYGSQVELKYDLKLTNTSELDYVNSDGEISKSYYYYGETDSNSKLVTLNSATLIDYVDSEMTLKAGQDGQWKVLDLAKHGLQLRDEEKDKLLKQYSTIVEADAIPENVKLSPVENGKPEEGKSQITTPIIVEKLLSSSDELSFENNGEVVSISKTGGSNITTKLGNYAAVLAGNPEADKTEPDEAKAQTTTIIPPTGKTNNNVLYAIIGVVSLAALGVGTYGVRRFLKK